MIYVSYRGRLGNKLIQYVLARILGEKFDQFVSYSLDVPDFPLIKTNIINRKIYKKTILVDDDNFLEILESQNLNSTNLVVSGYFQNKLFLSKYHKNILKLFDINYENKKGIFLHYRLGDFQKFKIRWVAHEYYIYCLDEILKTSNEKIYVSTDSPDHDLIKNLQKKYEINLIKESPKDTIICGSQFENKILSLGTFSWWIGFLGNQNNIYIPYKKNWKNFMFVEGWRGIAEKEYLNKK